MSKTTGVIQFTVRNYGRRMEGIAHHGSKKSQLLQLILFKDTKNSIEFLFEDRNNFTMITSGSCN